MENEESIKELLKDYLVKVYGRWVAGGVLEDYVRSKAGNKASCASRRLRELENEGTIERRYNQIDGKGVHFVEYRVKEVTGIPRIWLQRREASLF